VPKKHIHLFADDALYLEEHDQAELDIRRALLNEQCKNARPVCCGDNCHTSPCGKYRIMVKYYASGQDGCWDYSGADVFCGERLVCKINRNYASFWFHWIIAHPATGHDYILCGEDYQGYNVIDLTTGINYAYLPKAVSIGAGWCWIYVIDFNSETMQLVVDGCHWACPYERLTLDFSNPAKLPLPILYREELD
jgi:hypothetical protein